MKYTNLIKIKVMTETNAFICYLRKIPFIGKLIPDKIYRLYGVKKFLAWMGVMWDVLKGLFVTNLAILIFIKEVPKIFLNESEITIGLYVMLVMLMFGLGTTLGGSTVFKGQSDDFMFIHHFMVDPVLYYKYKIFRSVVIQGVFTFPVFVYMFENVFYALALMTFRIAVIIGTDALYLSMFKKKGRIINVRVRGWTSKAVELGALAACFLKLFSNISLSNVFFVILSVLSICVTVPSFLYVLRYDCYGRMAIKYADKSVITVSVSSGQDINEGESGLKSLTYPQGKDYFNRNKGKSPMNYLDAAFRYRYRKVIWEPIINNLIVQGVALLIVGGCVRTGWIRFDADNIFAYSPIVVSLTLMCSYASTYAHMYFRNIDCFILKSKMVTRKNVQDMMLGRYLKTLALDVAVVASLVADVALFVLASGIRIELKDLVYILAICPPILIIQDTYEWLIYFMIQPYALDMTVKSPVSRVVGYLSSFLTLLFIFIRTNITKALPAILLITLGVMGIYLICSKYAYKTFKLRA